MGYARVLGFRGGILRRVDHGVCDLLGPGYGRTDAARSAFSTTGPPDHGLFAVQQRDDPPGREPVTSRTHAGVSARVGRDDYAGHRVPARHGLRMARTDCPAASDDKSELVRLDVLHVGWVSWPARD